VVNPKDPGVVHMYKMIKTSCATAWIESTEGHRIPIIHESPLSVMLRSKFATGTGVWLGGETEVIYNDLKFSVDHEQYGYLSLFISSMKACMARPIPEGTPILSPPISGAPAKVNAPATAEVADTYE